MITKPEIKHRCSACGLMVDCVAALPNEPMRCPFCILEEVSQLRGLMGETTHEVIKRAVKEAMREAFR